MGHGFGPGGRLYLQGRRKRLPKRRRMAKVASHPTAEVESQVGVANSTSMLVGMYEFVMQLWGVGWGTYIELV